MRQTPPSKVGLMLMTGNTEKFTDELDNFNK